MRRLGALVIAVALVAAAAGCSLPGRVEGPVELTATFSDVGDLVAGHSVQVADVRVGSVTGIKLTKSYQAKVTMKIKDGLALPADSQAILRTTSLLGEKFIELRPPEHSASANQLVNHSVIDEQHTMQAPELEFVADQAVQVLSSVAAGNLKTIIETGATGFGGRAAELGSIVDSLSTISSTLADQTTNIVAIIDGLDKASATLAGSDAQVDALLTNLSKTTQVLADNRELVLQTLRDLTRLAKAQNDEVLGPYRDAIDRQIKQLDAVVALVADQRNQVSTLVDWLVQFTRKTPVGIPGDFAQIYAWLQLAPLEDGQ